MNLQRTDCDAVADCIMQMVFLQNRPDWSTESTTGVATLAEALSLASARNPFAVDERVLPFHPSHYVAPVVPESDTKQQQRRHSLFGRRRARERPPAPIEHHTLDMDISVGTPPAPASAAPVSYSLLPPPSPPPPPPPPPSVISPTPPSDNGLCKLCSQRPRQFILQACGHYYLCDDCLARSRHEGRVKCAYCRKESEGTLRVFEC